MGLRRPCTGELLTAVLLSVCRWLDGSSLIYAENVMGLVFDPPNRVTNQAGCTHGDYARPITLGKNVANVKFGGGLVSVS